jgi:AcrR family transcriptional regulator
MPRLIDGESRTDEIVRGICRIILREGLEGITLRKIGREVGVSAGTLHHHYESRDRLLVVCAHRFLRAFVSGTERRVPIEDLPAFLPPSLPEAADTRIWLAIEELGRTHPVIGHDVNEARERERWALATSATPALRPRDAKTAYAVLDGLRNAVCATHDPMPLELAQELFEASVIRLRPAA